MLGERPLSSPQCYENILEKKKKIKSLPQATRVPEMKEGSHGIRNAARWLPCRKPGSFPGFPSLESSHMSAGSSKALTPKGAFFSSLGGKLLGQTFPKGSSCPMLVTPEIDFLPSFFSSLMQRREGRVSFISIDSGINKHSFGLPRIDWWRRTSLGINQSRISWRL